MLSLQDERDITDVIMRYCDAMDRRDWDHFRTCFSDDFTADYGDGFTMSSGEHMTEVMQGTYRDLGQALHNMSNIVITEKDGAVTAKSYINGVSMYKDATLAIETFGYYDDVLVRTPKGWKIKFRRFTGAMMHGPALPK